MGGKSSSMEDDLPPIMDSNRISSDSFAILPSASRENAFAISEFFRALGSRPRLSRFVIVPQRTEAAKFGDVLPSLQMDSKRSRYSESNTCSASCGLSSYCFWRSLRLSSHDLGSTSSTRSLRYRYST